MFARLFLLFTLLPLVEIAVLVWLASRTSALFVLGLVIGTGFLGAWLARHQGLQAWRRIASEVDGGRMPGEALLDGFLVLLAAFLLILPGLLSDVLAIALLFPPTAQSAQGMGPPQLSGPRGHDAFRHVRPRRDHRREGDRQPDRPTAALARARFLVQTVNANDRRIACGCGRLGFF